MRGMIGCALCGGTVWDDRFQLVVGPTTLHACSNACLWKLKAKHVPPHVPDDDEDEKEPADAQPGWRLARWWNQTYKHRKKAWEQWKMEREFKRLQRRMKREAR